MNSPKIHNLIESFSSESLIDFFREKTSSFTPKRDQISSDNPDFINGQLVGVFTTDNENFGRDNVAVFSFKTGRPLNERSGKKAQYEVAKKILKNNTGYTAGIFVFYDGKGDFRFSLVYDIITDTAKRQWSNFRRFTYFVSREQTNKTFIRQISEAEFTSLTKIVEAFSVDKVRAEFYHEIACWYFWAMNKVKFPDDYKYSADPAKDAEIRNSTNLIRLLTRIIFIWFIKEKKLIPASLFDVKELKHIVKDFYAGKEASNYYNAILQNLFFGTLNQKMNERAFTREGDFSQNQKEYGVKNLYRYASMFAIPPEEAIALFKDIPFLNGGLFECLDKEDETGKVIYIDGFSRTRAKQAIINDYLFFQADEEKVNLSVYEMGKDKTVRGLIEILKSYNFTIDESTPVDQEVALDPEMLGKVFEELLASYNPETATTARKATGSFYTPREIVDYMVQQSVKHYLLSNTQLDEATIEKLIAFSDDAPDLSEDQKKQIIELVDNIKILDPACGSGAFSMGLLHQLVFILQKLDPDNKVWYEVQYNKALEETQKAFKHSDKSEREELLKEINESFDENINYPDYARKLYLIENCIYGVDIQPIAIQISKLRFFISLVIDQKIDPGKENYGIRPLPNLETKFVAANTLIGINISKQHTYYTDKIRQIEKDIAILRHKYFLAKSRNEKRNYQLQDKTLRNALKEELLKLGYTLDWSKKIIEFDIFDTNTSADWFDPEWMFGVTGGFDIVIGNPPYIQLQKAANPEQKYADFYKDQEYETFDRMGDIYCLFYERGIQLLKPDGILCYITSNKWMRAGYGEKLRDFFTKYNPLQLVDLGPGVFENATVDTNILIIRKTSNQNHLKAVTLQKVDKEDISNALNEKGVLLTKLTKDAWFIGSDAEQRLKEKIDRIGKPLKNWDVNMYRGVLTGLNEAFIITTEKRNEILANCQDEAERRRTEEIIKPILRGRDIKRYYYEWAGLWVIFIPWHFPLHEDLSIQGSSEKAEKEFQKQYPTVYQHLLQFKDSLSKRNKEETGIRYEWYALQRCAATYYPEFEKEKVVWQELAQGSQFAYDGEGEYFVANTAYILTGKNLKYILGYLNSKLNEFTYENWYCTKLGQKGTRWLNQHVIEIPLPPITAENQPIVSQIEALVDKILAAKKQNQTAEISHWEREIDELVYKLYDLNEEEIRIVENNK